MTESTKPNSTLSLITRIVNKMKEEKWEMHLNSRNEPTIRIPGDAYQKDWPASSQRVQDLVQSYYYELSNGKGIRSSDLALLMGLIREDCRKGGCKLAEYEMPYTEEDVIVQAMLCLMNKQEHFQDRTSLLLETLSGFQRDGKVSYHEEIPVFLNIFSRKLGRLIPTLKGFGISVPIEHKEDGSHCTVNRLDSFQVEKTDDSKPSSSGQPSGVSSSHGTDLAKTNFENRQRRGTKTSTQPNEASTGK